MLFLTDAYVHDKKEPSEYFNFMVLFFGKCINNYKLLTCLQLEPGKRSGIYIFWDLEYVFIKVKLKM